MLATWARRTRLAAPGDAAGARRPRLVGSLREERSPPPTCQRALLSQAPESGVPFLCRHFQTPPWPTRRGLRGHLPPTGSLPQLTPQPALRRQRHRPHARQSHKTVLPPALGALEWATTPLGAAQSHREIACGSRVSPTSRRAHFSPVYFSGGGQVPHAFPRPQGVTAKASRTTQTHKSTVGGNNRARVHASHRE